MGPWGIAALLTIVAVSTDTGRTYLRKAFKSGIKAGLAARESAAEMAEKAKDYRDELVAEIRAEDEDTEATASSGNGRAKKAANRGN